MMKFVGAKHPEEGFGRQCSDDAECSWALIYQQLIPSPPNCQSALRHNLKLHGDFRRKALVIPQLPHPGTDASPLTGIFELVNMVKSQRKRFKNK